MTNVLECLVGKQTEEGSFVQSLQFHSKIQCLIEIDQSFRFGSCVVVIFAIVRTLHTNNQLNSSNYYEQYIGFNLDFYTFSAVVE